MNRLIAVIIGAVILVTLLLFGTTYSVSFNQVAILTTFGAAESVQRDPGLHLKLPAPIQGVRSYDTRLQLVDMRPDTINTKDELQVIVQAFMLWQINSDDEGALAFARSYDSEIAPKKNLEDDLATAATTVLKQYTFEQLIGENSQLAAAEKAILEELRAPRENGLSLADRGINPVVVGLSQVVLPPKTTENVIKRMQEERQIRALTKAEEGEAEYQTIVSQGALKSSKILAFADRLAEEIRAEGDREAADALTIMNEDPEFAIFLVWLDTMKETASSNATIYIPTSFAPWHLMNFEPDVVGVPQPPVGDLDRTELAAGSSSNVSGGGATDAPAENDETDGDAP